MQAEGIHQYPGTIANGTALSGAIPIGVDTLVGLWMPAAWTAANITFQVSPDGGTTWLELLNDAGTAVTLTNPVGGAFIVMTTAPKYAFRGINMMKVRSGTSGVPVNQVADRIMTLIGRFETA